MNTTHPEILKTCHSCIQSNQDREHFNYDMSSVSCDACGNFCCSQCMEDTTPIKNPIDGQMYTEVCYACRERIKEIESAFRHNTHLRESLQKIVAVDRALTRESTMTAIANAQGEMAGIAISTLGYLGYSVEGDLPPEMKAMADAVDKFFNKIRGEE